MYPMCSPTIPFMILLVTREFPKICLYKYNMLNVVLIFGAPICQEIPNQEISIFCLLVGGISDIWDMGLDRIWHINNEKCRDLIYIM